MTRQSDPMTLSTKTTAETITDEQLTALFAAHCECRPLDIDRTDDDHSHDCDTGVLDDIQCALNATDCEEQCAAKFRCAEIWNRDLVSDIYRPLLVAAITRPPMTVQEWTTLTEREAT